jgi:dolichol-phosphate mannosyltransferase
MRCQWTRIAEIPYQFHARAAGQSKSNFSQGMNVIRHIWRLLCEIPAAGRTWKFLLVGATGALLNLALFTIGLHLTWPIYLAWILGTEGSIISNWFLNSTITWRDHSQTSWILRLLMYHGMTALSIIINFLMFIALLKASFTPFLAQATALLLSTFVNYFLTRFFVFERTFRPAADLRRSRFLQAAPDPASSLKT